MSRYSEHVYQGFCAKHGFALCECDPDRDHDEDFEKDDYADFPFESEDEEHRFFDNRERAADVNCGWFS